MTTNIPAQKSNRPLAVLVATGFGLGYAPVASGTFGTLLGLPLAWLLGRYLPGPLLQLAAAFALAALAIPFCDIAERQFGHKDDGRIVADEYLTLPLVCVGLPVAAHPWLLGLAFLAHRLFDISKPWPARSIQALKGGLGIVADDVIAALYGLGLCHLVWWFIAR